MTQNDKIERLLNEIVDLQDEVRRLRYTRCSCGQYPCWDRSKGNPDPDEYARMKEAKKQERREKALTGRTRLDDPTQTENDWQDN